MHESITFLTGNVATEPRHVETDSGVHITSFRVASTPRRRKDGTFVDLDTSYVTVSCFRFAAQNVAASIHKGDPVFVVGSMRVREWEREGRSGVTTEIEAKAIGHDLSRGVSRFTKVVRTRTVGSEEDEAFLARFDEQRDEQADQHADAQDHEHAHEHRDDAAGESVDVRTGEIYPAARGAGAGAQDGARRGRAGEAGRNREAATSAA